MAKTGATTECRWLFRDSRPSLRTLCSAVFQSPYFSARRMDLFRFFFRSEYEYCASVFVSPLFKHHLPNLSSHLQSNVRAHAPPGPLDQLCKAVTNQDCLALDLPCSSHLKRNFAGSRFPVACLCQDLSTSVSRMHACHFESSLDLIMFQIFWNNWTDPLISMLKTNCCWKMMTVLMQWEVLSCPFFK